MDWESSNLTTRPLLHEKRGDRQGGGDNTPFQTMYKIQSQISSPNFIFRHKFLYLELPESLEMRKILEHGIRMPKNPQTRVDIFWIFMDFHDVMWV